MSPATSILHEHLSQLCSLYQHPQGTYMSKASHTVGFCGREFQPHRQGKFEYTQPLVKSSEDPRGWTHSRLHGLFSWGLVFYFCLWNLLRDWQVLKLLQAAWPRKSPDLLQKIPCSRMLFTKTRFLKIFSFPLYSLIKKCIIPGEKPVLISLLLYLSPPQSPLASFSPPSLFPLSPHPSSF